MKKADVTVGMSVTLTEPMYGDHFGRPYPQETCHNMAHSWLIQPGVVGTVASVDLPVVCHTKGNPTSFVCVDFIEPQSGCRFRVRPYYRQIRKVGV